MPTLYSSSSSSLHRPQSAALTRPARPQSAQPAYKYTSPEPNYTNYPSSPAHRAPPQLHLAVGNAASSLAGVVTKLRESVGRQTDGRIAAWSVDVKEHADNLRRLAEEAEYVDEAEESRTVRLAAANAPDFEEERRTVQARTVQAQRRFEALIAQLEEKQLQLAKSMRKVHECACLLACVLLTFLIY